MVVDDKDFSLDSYRSSHVGVGRGLHYDRLLEGKYDHWIWTTLSRVYLCQTLKSECSKGAAAYMDFACGTGRITEVASGIFPEVIGVDISHDMLEVARARLPTVSFYQGDVTQDAALVKQQFDCMTAFRFFLNAEPALRRDVLAWMSEHVRSGGVLIGNIHMNPWSISGFITLLSIKIFGRKVNVMSRKKLEALLKEYGFIVEQWRGFRLLPTINGRAILPSKIQAFGDGMLTRFGLGFFGADQFFVARRGAE